MNIKGAITQAEFQSQVEPPKEVRYLRGRVKELENTIESYHESEGKISETLHEIGLTVEASKPFASQYIPDTSTKSSIEAVLQLSDWHYGGYQESDEIEGFGEFSPEIARDRVLEKLVPRFVNWVSVHRKGYNLKDLRILALGDLISGDIHQELKITNAFPSPVQSVKVAYLFADMVTMLAPHFNKVTIDFITADNHARLMKKPQSKEEGLNTYGYIIAYFAKEILKNHQNIKFNIYNKAQQIVSVNGQRYLLAHGHQMRGWAGIPYYGIERQVGKEARKRIRAKESIRNKVRFDKLVIGHFHAPINADDWMIGGCLSGTDAYDHKNGRYSRATQPCWLVHPTQGEFNWTRLWLD